MPTAIVTGGATRVGEVICRRLAADGYRVIVHYNESRDDALALAQEIDGVAVGVDLRDSGHWQELFNKTGEAPSLLVNNASVYYRDNFAAMSLDNLRESLEINCIAPIGLMQLFAQNASSGASIVNILDQRISGVDIHSASYSLAKQCLANANSMAALAFASQGIRVNGIAPGYVLPPKGVPMTAMDKFIEASPLKRRTSEMEIAEAVVFLAKMPSVTGEVIFMDAGLHLHNADIGEKRQ